MQIGVIWPWVDYGMPLEERTLPQLLGEAGYFTAICGKWHLGHAKAEYLPLSRGFTHQYGHYNGALDYFTHERDGGLDWHRNQQPLVEEGYTTNLIGQEAARLLRAHDFAQQPMFLYVPFNAPHAPMQAPDEYLARYEHLEKPKRQTFAAMVTCLDDAVGEITTALHEAGQTDNTLIVFFSDNGGPRQLGADNGLLRAGKATLYEGGVRVPAFCNWPNVVPAGAKVSELMHVTDLYPTLLAVAAVKPDEPSAIDGVNQWAAIVDKQPSARHEVLLNTTPFHGAVRIGDWKLVRNGHIRSTEAKPAETEQVELFHLAEDPYEEHNLAESNAEKLAELTERLEEFAAAAAKPMNQRRPADYKAPKVW